MTHLVNGSVPVGGAWWVDCCLRAFIRWGGEN